MNGIHLENERMRPNRSLILPALLLSTLAVSSGATLAQTDGSYQTVTCGSPGIDPVNEAGLHLWKACDGPWTQMLTGDPGTGTVTAVGSLSSTTGFISVTPQSLESSDSLTNNNPQRIDFDLRTASPWMDHFEFTTRDGDALCIENDGQRLFIGPGRVPAGDGPVNPETLQSCVLNNPTSPDNLINAALTGTAKQSPTETDGDAPNAIDGNTDGNFSNGSVSRTYRAFEPFWEVDLGEIRDIRQIVIHPRTDCCTEDLENFHVLISNIPFVRFASEIRPDEGGLATLDDRLAQPGVSNRYVPNSSPLTSVDFARSGRYVRVQNRDPGRMELAEVKVLVEADSSVGACGSPGVNFRTEGGLHLWKSCDGPWNLMLSGYPEASTVSAAGTLSANLGFTDVIPQSLEGEDTVTNTDPQRIGFDLSTGSPWMDRFQFTKSGDDALCVALDSNSTGQPLLIGPTRAPAGNGPINPEIELSRVPRRNLLQGRALHFVGNILQFCLLGSVLRSVGKVTFDRIDTCAHRAVVID